MTRYQVIPLIVLVVMVIACVTLMVLKLPAPAIFVAILMNAAQAVLPSASNKVNVAAANASIAPPPLPPDDAKPDPPTKGAP